MPEIRELFSHKVNGLNEVLQIVAVDEPGPGNACREYQIIDVSRENTGPDATKTLCDIQFQNGDPAVEVNGISNEALLAIVEDRLIGFQNGPFKGKENACALTHIQEALMWLHKRTNDRLRRGVEGKQTA